ncbi:2,3-dihydroxybenzoate-AMP ligase [Thermobifida fusca YX]|uniref:2,3-dihydroxybenzoate-AMP ligase n=2 Tax=Thermobifida fusca TaxID=2021 RepID=A0A9P2TB68_THEFU|nr:MULTISPECIES: (2,3-dihydroxybenzoyl)adenylate synthase [Thermobifida]AAZ55904.1 2,3-dihydroxybenzoate-AMP ligase [Thermobifida fusca YX]EOR71046.1 2,3-dihydroxybenzoate-AMP ligase [Thermobifida fusca TM51]MBO2531227.1 (2,3-dihydroxybenzoyl)adenylate synthase [Thermobifida sp.]MDD6793379.1 (2,3-dihydroxybenzoyl)adenylate synthase [Thermobifida fusca]PPS93618.1 enterobactin synthase subunit E [Thermobifida fusca]
MLDGCTPWPAEFAVRYREAGYWTGETFSDFVTDRTRRFADRLAVVGAGQRWTYAELGERSAVLATGLARLGIAAGDRVVVQLPNIPELFEVVFALFRLGALPVYALPAHRAHEITHLCTTAQAKALIIPDRHAGFDYRTMAAQLRHAGTAPEHVVVVGEPGGFTPLAELRADRPDPGVFTRPEASDAAFLQLSGGTTGLPKLIPRTHDDYLYSVRASAEICALGTDTVYLAALPAVHNFPMSSPGFLGTFHAGGTVVLAPNPSPDTAFSLIETERVTITAVVPPIALQWLDAVEHGSQSHRDLSSLRVLQVGGAKFAPEAARRVRPVLGCTLQQVFGMAEGLVNYTRLDDPDDIITTTQGRPISPDDEIRIVDEADRPVPDGEVGHLLTRGPYTIRGYYRAEEHNATAFTPDGFYRTGDLVRRTPTGHLVVEGRAKDQINRGGEKVSAEEVENHILAHPAVHDAAVVGMSDPYLGERVCAYVIARTEPPSRSELLRFLRERGLASYKIPDRVEFVDRFPVTGVGKISRSELRRELARRLDTTR